MSESPASINADIAKLRGFSRIVAVLFTEARRPSTETVDERMKVFALFAGLKCAELDIHPEETIKEELGRTLYLVTAGTSARS